MLETQEAISRLLNLVDVMNSENISITKCNNRVLAQNLVAKLNHPPFNSSAMDGYAINNKDKVAGKKLKVIGESAAGKGFDGFVKRNQAVQIFTGAPIPKGTNNIIINEDVKVEFNQIIIKETFEKPDYIRPKGLDFKKGTSLLSPLLLKPSHLSLLAAMNFSAVPVFSKPKVALLATGNELITPGKKPGLDQIVSSNSYGLSAMLESFGALPKIFPIVPDDVSSIQNSLKLADCYDLIITIGGASVGKYDLIKRVAFSDNQGLDFYKIAMRPGKPFFAGKINGVPIVGLPGNPVSSLICCFILVKPMIKKMLGLKNFSEPRVTAKLKKSLSKNSNREHFMRAKLTIENNEYFVEGLANQDSSLITELAKSDCLIVRPINSKRIPKGEKVKVIKFFHFDI